MREISMLFTAPVDFDHEVAMAFRDIAKVSFFHVRERGELVSLKGNHHTWVCNPKQQFVVDADILDAFPNLCILATPSTGTNHIDLNACKERGVKVLSLLDDRESLERISASAEFTFKLLLDALRMPPPLELQGKIVGLVGYGRIGKRMAKWLSAFEATIWVHDPYAHKFSIPLEDLFDICDAVVVCCALTEETRGMIDGDLLNRMKIGAALVNTARGEIIDEDDLLNLMVNRPDLRIALDVLCGETTGEHIPDIFRLQGAIVTDHIAGETFDSRTKASKIILRLLRKELEGREREAFSYKSSEGTRR